MMEALGLWLKELVVVILIATFVELLLTGHSMLRYVRTVVSLFILLTILTPIIRFLTGEFDPDRMLAADLEPNGRQEEVRSLGAVLTEGERLRERREREALEVARRQVEAAIASELEARFPVRVLDVRTEIGYGEDGPAIRNIRAALSALEKPPDAAGEGGEVPGAGTPPGGEAEEAASGAGIAEVRVEDVVIGDISVEDIAIGDIFNGDSPIGRGGTASSGTPAFRPTDAGTMEAGARDIAGWLAERWNVDPRNVEIVWNAPETA